MANERDGDRPEDTATEIPETIESQEGEASAEATTKEGAEKTYTTRDGRTLNVSENTLPGGEYEYSLQGKVMQDRAAYVYTSKIDDRTKIDDLKVMEGDRKQGLGSEVLRHAEVKAYQDHSTEIYGDLSKVDAKDKNARQGLEKFYSSNGYKVDWNQDAIENPNSVMAGKVSKKLRY